MSKHTPGPWTYSTHDSGWCYSINIHQAENAEYTPDYSDVAFCTCSGERKMVQEANARLIAAAPELLDALIGICRNMPTDGDMADAGWTADQIDAACNAYDKARAAIAKATGE